MIYFVKYIHFMKFNIYIRRIIRKSFQIFRNIYNNRSSNQIKLTSASKKLILLFRISFFNYLLWRREWDLNPRNGITRSPVFEAGTIDHSDISPHNLHYNYTKYKYINQFFIFYKYLLNICEIIYSTDN